MIYFSKTNIKGQTSIELIVLILIVSTIVISLSAGMVPKLGDYFNNQKIKWRNRIASEAKVYRSDFEPMQLALAEEKGKEDDEIDTQGDRARELDREGRDSSDQYGDGSDQYGQGAQVDGGRRGDGVDTRAGEAGLRDQESAKTRREEQGTSSDRDQDKTKEELEKERLEKELRGLSEEEKDKILLSRRFQEDQTYRRKNIFKSKNFALWKLLLIIGIIIFFIIIFVKSRSKDD